MYYSYVLDFESQIINVLSDSYFINYIMNISIYYIKYLHLYLN